MKKTENRPALEDYDGFSMPVFGNELLREVLLPDFLGKEYDAIMYWFGRSLARKYPLHSKEEVIDFFLKAGWGYLSVSAEGKNKIKFYLSSKLVSKRIERNKAASFSLESGFLAQQIQLITERSAEAENPVKKKSSVYITVHWDRKNKIETE